MNTAEVEISGRTIGPGHPCFLIAEIGVNHNGSPELAKKMISAAAKAGADAVKFQTFRSERIVAADTPKAEYQINREKPDETQLDMLRKYELPQAVYPDLMKLCADLNVVFMSTPFDYESADFLDSMGVPAYKIGSAELTYHVFLRHVAKKKRPLILSTGMAFIGEVEAAVSEIKAAGNDLIVLLHCVSNYPSSPADTNLRAIETMEKAFRLPVGFSDHSLGLELAFAAVARGACVIERHFTLDKASKGPDHSASLEPHEFATMVEGIRNIERALGSGIKEPSRSEVKNRLIGRRKIVARRNISASSTIIEEDIIGLRSSKGILIEDLKFVIGRRASRDIFEGQPVNFEDIM